MSPPNRRHFLRAAGAGLGVGLGLECGSPVLFEQESFAQERGKRPPLPPDGVAVVNPRDRVPVSLIIDDSTCLVNLAHFAIPQFHEVFPDQYHQPWKTLPREIPDNFVRRFGEWCGARGIKGKYSIVPYPACVGWLDRDLPGWSRQELERQPRPCPQPHDAPLGHSPGNDQPHLGHRHTNRPTLSRANRGLHGKLGL